MGFEDYSDLGSTGFQGGGGGEQTPPEEEFYHSVYISASNRKNHINVVEQADKFQIRGVQYNLDEVNMVITHTKEILAKIKSEKGKDSTECFSFKDGVPPWYGTSKLASGDARQCPQTSAERAVNDFCSPCRAQIIVAGIYCKPDGTPILTEEKKPIFVFIRGKGMRYSNVSQYLGDLYNEEGLAPIFEPVTEQSIAFEKAVVNNKRFVTKLTGDKEKSSYGGMVNIFVLKRGVQLDPKTVKSVLNLSKQTLGHFNEKFDWSKRKGSSAVGYGQRPEGVLPVDDPVKTESKQDKEPVQEPTNTGKVFSFDDINF
jgi:hypothetical protein